MTELLVMAVDRAFSKSSWHGTTLKGALRGLKPELALWRPSPDRKSIWELLLHAAYWKYIVRRALTEDKSLKFGRSPSNWPAVPDPPTAKALKADIRFLQEEHDRLREAILAFPPNRLGERMGGAGSVNGMILGVAAHDTHHGGQIQLIKRLMGTRESSDQR